MKVDNMNDKERMLRAYREIEDAKYYKSHLRRFMPNDIVYDRSNGDSYKVSNLEPVFRFDLIFNTYFWFHFVEDGDGGFKEFADCRLTTKNPKE